MYQKENVMDVLTADQRHRYWEIGWLVVEGVFGRSRVDGIAELARAIGSAEMEQAPVGLAAGYPENYRLDRSASGETAPRKIGSPFTKHQQFRDFALDPKLREMVNELIGKPVDLMGDQIFLKPPRFGSRKPYHQDNAYFRCFPADDVITAWIALNDVDEQNGCVRYIDGSHRGPLLPHEPVAGEPFNQAPRSELIDLSKESPARVGRGGVVFHHSQTLHTSHENRSDRWRCGYATHWVHRDVRCETDVLDAAYFHRADYPSYNRLSRTNSPNLSRTGQ